jgi:hypothetical protein
VILKMGFGFWLESLGNERIAVNDRPALRTRLCHGDRIRLGATDMMFFCRGPALTLLSKGLPQSRTSSPGP